MLHIDPSPERARLTFKDAALSSFRFLCDLAFRPVQEEDTFVRYESSLVFVNVYHGRASFELGVEIGRLAEAGEKLTLYDMVARTGAEEAEGFGQHVMFQVSTREGVQELVPKLAGLVQKYGPQFLNADANAYREALEARSRAAAEYEKQVPLRNLRGKVETAWQAKDFARVIELSQAMRDDLTEVEAKRLAYAEGQLLPADTGASRRVAQP
jgi:hypothetical protein